MSIWPIAKGRKGEHPKMYIVLKVTPCYSQSWEFIRIVIFLQALITYLYPTNNILKKNQYNFLKYKHQLAS